MKKRTKIIIAIAVYVVLVGVFLFIYNYKYERDYDYDKICVWLSDDTTGYTAEDFEEYGVIKIEKTSHDDSYVFYISNPLMLKSKIDNLYKQLEEDERIEWINYYSVAPVYPVVDEALEMEKTMALTIGLTVLTGGLVVSIVCINKKHKK